ncbi:hypothetical protein [Lysinibacillus sp. NPDC092081]|uniref:hypothetical protein n=1 Tax=Lysinibacillus sp. NPDC092081 TaxID=3364131 RepID=UPI0038283E18
MAAMKTELKSEIAEMRQEMTGMNQRFDKLDKAIEGLKMDINEFKTLSTQENDRIYNKLNTIESQMK